ncbi:MAG TPA: EpsI family protein [Gemmatimonadaceae bacterium]|nr:EpsI family protein [Gemmatimonadaceae bacterium]
MRDRRALTPAIVLGVGCLMLLSVQAQRSMALQAPLSMIPDPVPGYTHSDVVIAEDEARVAGMTSYVNRVFKDGDREVYGLYVGFYDSQSQGKTVHSPKNCLPGGGWEAMESGTRTIATSAGPAEVNRYVISDQRNTAIVYYWYQGRGRVAHNEYLVKWDLLRDAALHRRTDEALVRLVIPVTEQMSPAEADALAEQAAKQIIPTLDRFLPV